MYVYQIVHWPSQRAIPKCFFELRTVALIFIKKKKKKRKKLEGLTYQRVQDGCITCWIGRLALVAEAWIQITALFLND